MTDISAGARLSPGNAEELVLVAHPDFPHHAIRSVSVEVGREADGILCLTYRVTGAIGDALWPVGHPDQRSGPTDRLWEHSCFEAFVGRSGEPGYVELNVATSLQWALYAFDDYRAGMTPVDAAVSATMRFCPDSLDAAVSVLPPPLFRSGVLELGISAIIEERNGTKSYWALAHAPGPPDFHNRDCFTARLAAPTAP